MEPNNAAPAGEPSNTAPQSQVAPTEAITPKPETISSQLSQTNEPAKSSKPLICTLIILVVIAIAAAGVFAYLYFTKPTTPPSEPSEETSQETPPEETAEETEITDTYILRDLDEKMAILHRTEETGRSILRNVYEYGYTLPLYTKGDLSDIAKLTHTALSIIPDRYLGYDEIQAIIKEQGFDERTAEEYKNSSPKGINSETLAAKYYDVFGETPVKGSTNSDRYCPMTYYNSQYDFYYDPGIGCGGTGPYTGRFYKNKYTSDGEHAYVYVNAGTHDGEDGKIYCDVINYEASGLELPAVCGEAESRDGFVLDESNYQKFAEYRFVFNKADNGTYYFVKAEKL